MGLSNELISQFVKMTNDDKRDTQVNTTVYGTVKYDGKYYVQLDGSELLTPVQTTTDVKDGERVTVTIENHTATITGNLSSPSARTEDVQTIGKQVSEFEIVVADKVKTEDFEAVNASIENLRVVLASIDTLSAHELEAADAVIGDLAADAAKIEYLDAGTINALNANIEKLEATFGNFESISTEDFEALNAEITNLKGYSAEFTHLRAEALTAARADLKDAHIKYAKIDFANIGSAAIEKLFSDSGIIDSLVVSDGKITGELVGVTISGDLIKGNTIQAEKLIVKGEDGLYHRLNIEGGATTTETITEEDLQNGLHGSVLVAKSVTAESIAVDDLVAFGATIGGFEITDESIHTKAKDIAESSIPGVYMDNDGQFSVGDGDNYIKYVKNESNAFELLIAAGNIAKQIEDATAALEETAAKVNRHFTFNNNGITISNGDNTLSLRLDAGIIYFEKNGSPFGSWDGVDFRTGNIKIEVTERAQFGNFGFVPRSDGSLSFLKLEHRTGFYMILTGTIATIFVAYPILEDTTMVLTNGITGELLDGTLTLTEEVG